MENRVRAAAAKWPDRDYTNLPLKRVLACAPRQRVPPRLSTSQFRVLWLMLPDMLDDNQARQMWEAVRQAMARKKPRLLEHRFLTRAQEMTWELSHQQTAVSSSVSRWHCHRSTRACLILEHRLEHADRPAEAENPEDLVEPEVEEVGEEEEVPVDEPAEENEEVTMVQKQGKVAAATPSKPSQ